MRITSLVLLVMVPRAPCGSAGLSAPLVLAALQRSDTARFGGWSMFADLSL